MSLEVEACPPPPPPPTCPPPHPTDSRRPKKKNKPPPPPATIGALFRGQVKKRCIKIWKAAAALRKDARQRLERLQNVLDLQYLELGLAQWKRYDALEKKSELLRKLEGLDAGPCTCATSYNGLCLHFDLDKVAQLCEPVEASQEILKLRGSLKPMVGLKHRKLEQGGAGEGRGG